MKDCIIGIGLLVIAAMLWVVSSQASDDTRYNEVLIQCLLEHDYDIKSPIDERMAFEFSQSSMCAHSYLIELYKQRDKRLQKFLEENPRYRIHFKD